MYTLKNFSTPISISKPVPTHIPNEVHPHPPGRNIYLENFVHTARRKLDSSLKECKDRQEQKTIKTVRRNADITFRPADKLSLVTIRNTNDYIEEAENELKDTNFYQEVLNIPPFSYIINTLAYMLSDTISPI